MRHSVYAMVGGWNGAGTVRGDTEKKEQRACGAAWVGSAADSARRAARFLSPGPRVSPAHRMVAAGSWFALLVHVSFVVVMVERTHWSTTTA